MKPVSMHPLSVLAGSGLLGLVLVAAGAVQVPIRVQPIPTFAQGQIPPRDLVVVREGVPYTVPVGKRLVVTAVGSSHPTVGSVQLLIDGIPEITTHTETPTTMREVPRWLVVNTASTLVVAWGDGASDDGRAWGYLVDA